MRVYKLLVVLTTVLLLNVASALGQTMEEAGRLYNSGDYKKAAKAFSGVIKNEPTALAYYNRALCYYNMRKWKKAVRDCESALSCYPSRSLRDAVDALYDDASRRRQDQLDRRANLWTNIAAGVAVGAVVTGAIVDAANDGKKPPKDGRHGGKPGDGKGKNGGKPDGNGGKPGNNGGKSGGNHGGKPGGNNGGNPGGGQGGHGGQGGYGQGGHGQGGQGGNVGQGGDNRNRGNRNRGQGGGNRPRNNRNQNR